MSYRYYQILELRSPAALANRLRQSLFEKGCLGLEETVKASGVVTFRAYFEATDAARRVQELSENFGTALKIEAREIGIPVSLEQEVSFEPYRFTQRFFVSPSKDACTEPCLLLKAGSAFGTGKHETTRLAGRLLESIDLEGQSLLDVGTGSGILAIQASSLGASEIAAVEILPEALELAEENFILNHCQNVRLTKSTQELKSSYEIVVANMLLPSLIHLKSEFLRLLKPVGKLIVSGILRTETEMFLKSFSEFEIATALEEGDWMGAILKRGH